MDLNTSSGVGRQAGGDTGYKGEGRGEAERGGVGGGGGEEGGGREMGREDPAMGGRLRDPCCSSRGIIFHLISFFVLAFYTFVLYLCHKKSLCTKIRNGHTTAISFREGPVKKVVITGKITYTLCSGHPPSYHGRTVEFSSGTYKSKNSPTAILEIAEILDENDKNKANLHVSAYFMLKLQKK